MQPEVRGSVDAGSVSSTSAVSPGAGGQRTVGPFSERMSLRVTLILGIALVLAMSVLCGTLLLYWHAVSKVDTEMGAVLEVGQRTVLNGLVTRERAQRDWVAVVRSLDGDRHLRAMLLSPQGEVLARSLPLSASNPAPAWFYRMLAGSPGVRRISVPMGGGSVGSLELQTDAHNEIAEAWSDATLTFMILVLFCSLNSLSVYWIVGRALSPLDALIAAFHRVGRGDYEVQAPERGPLELVQLSRHFNQMVGQLADMSQRKERLEEQLVEVQEEERAELARDLHDEIGPLLFAVAVDLVALQSHEALRADPRLQERLAATGEAVSRMQQQVRATLGRLRPAIGIDLGLQHSFERLTAFWSLRYPAVSFEVDLDEEPVSREVASQVYRIVQESVSNALRHGHPSRIALRVRREGTELLRVEISDDGKGLHAGLRSGQGLTGMRERVQALGGTLEICAADSQGRGVRVQACLPVSSLEVSGEAAHRR